MRGFGLPEMIIFLFFFAMVFLLPILFLRYRKQLLMHQERMAALEKGAELPPIPPEGGLYTPRVYLLRGLIWLFSGIGLTVFLLALVNTAVEPVPLSQRLYEAQHLRQMGAPEDQVKQMIDSRETSRRIPIGLPLIGLVPIGVGFAYLIFYFGERKQFAAPQR